MGHRQGRGRERRHAVPVALALAALVSCACRETAPQGTPRATASTAPAATTVASSTATATATVATLPAPSVPPRPLPPHPDEPRSDDRACRTDSDCVVFEDRCACPVPCDAEWRVAKNKVAAAKISAANVACPPTECEQCPVGPPTRPGQAAPFRGYIGSRAVCQASQCTVVE